MEHVETALSEIRFFCLFFFKKKTASNRLQIHMIHSPGHCAETTGSMWAIIVASDHFCPAVIQSNNPRKSFCSQFLSVTDDILSSLPTQLSLFLWTNTFQTLFHWALHFKDELSCLMLKKTGSEFHRVCLWYKICQMKLLGRRSRSSLFHQVDVYISVTFMTSCGV